MNLLIFAMGLPQAQSGMRSEFQWGRIRGPEDWLLPIAALTLILAYVWWLYRRDSHELHPALAVFLGLLRTLAFVGLLLVWLRPQWRQEEDVVTPSRVVVLVDTSLSMAESATDGTPAPSSAPAPGEAPTSAGAAPGSRSAAAIDLLKSPQWNAIRKTHELHLAAFGAGQARPLAVLPKLGPDGKPIDGEAAAGAKATEDWAKSLEPVDAETRLGEALSQTMFQHRFAPVSGIVVVSDGGQNTGLEPDDALRGAQADRLPPMPLFTVGLGSSAQLKNVRLNDISAPARTYPNDAFNVKAYVQSQGMQGEAVSVDLLWRAVSPSGEVMQNAPPLKKESQKLVLPADGKPVAVEFTLKPEKLGRTTVQVAIAAPEGDHNRNDNALDVDVEITERRNRILLFASGATREYQFLRNQLQRILRSDGSKDKEFVVDVLLQTGSDGISQDSSEILPDFPSTAAEMHEYDCVVAFDPDWRRLSPEQIGLLKNWIESEAGGLILVAGRIYTDVTARDPTLGAVRSLYPVEFGRLLPGARDLLTGASEPWRLEFTAEGAKSEFLSLVQPERGGVDGWDEFDGFYDYYPVKGVKDKAVVLAGLRDPRAAAADDDGGRKFLIIDRAQGAGRVLYLGGGEFWRLRAVNSAHFTRLYTQMVRHVGQARLLRDSKRGVLMVDHDNGRYVLNDLVEVRARLADAQSQPLKADEVPLEIVLPDQSTETVQLQKDPALPGNFRGVFPVRQTGAYRLDVTLPDGDRELLTRRLQVRVPNKESDDVRLNAALLGRLAETSGGAYYEGAAAVFAGSAKTAALPKLLADKTRTTPRLARPISLWDNQGTMIILCSLLCLEWLIRRLVKLA